MKIVFNTRTPDAVASYNYRGALSSINILTLDDWDHYEKYDIALFMTYNRDLEELAKAKKKYPNLKVGLIDPRGSFVETYLKYVDFLVIDSIEMKDFFSRYQLPMFTYYEYPNIAEKTKEHKNKEPVIIGYHGNAIHLMSMYPNVSEALDLLAKNFNIEFWAMFNIKKNGLTKIGLPKNLPVRHIQWSEENFYKYLAKADIGIVPNLMPIKNLRKIKSGTFLSRRIFNDSSDDYLIRFKMPSNPGRFIIFGLLGIPVVADIFPSSLQFIKDEYNGLLAYSTGGWYTAIRQMIEGVELRKRLSGNMKHTINEYFKFEKQNEKFLFFLRDLNNSSSYTKNEVIETKDINFKYKFMLYNLYVQRLTKRIIRFYNKIKRR